MKSKLFSTLFIASFVFLASGHNAQAHPIAYECLKRFEKSTEFVQAIKQWKQEGYVEHSAPNYVLVQSRCTHNGSYLACWRNYLLSVSYRLKIEQGAKVEFIHALCRSDNGEENLSFVDQEKLDKGLANIFR